MGKSRPSDLHRTGGLSRFSDAMRIASLLSDFVDAQQAYLESAGLIALDP